MQILIQILPISCPTAVVLFQPLTDGRSRLETDQSKACSCPLHILRYGAGYLFLGSAGKPLLSLDYVDR